MKTIFMALLVSTSLFASAQNYQPIEIYPAPAIDVMYVQVPESFIGMTDIFITDLNGQVWYTAERNFDQYDFRKQQIDVGAFPQGYYLLNIRSTDNWMMQKFVKR